MDELTTSSVDGLLQKISLLASRPIPEFNQFEALNMLEVLKNAAQDAKQEKAGYYKYTFETLHEKVALPDDQFHNFLLLLLGDKIKSEYWMLSPRYRPLHCYYCNSFGHVKLHCLQRKREMGASGVSCGPSQQSQNPN